MYEIFSLHSRYSTGGPKVRTDAGKKGVTDVFPEELPGILPDRQIEFLIDIVPRTASISKTPYRMAPIKMKKLMAE